jgi:hypothetical protein
MNYIILLKYFTFKFNRDDAYFTQNFTMNIDKVVLSKIVLLIKIMLVFYYDFIDIHSKLNFYFHVTIDRISYNFYKIRNMEIYIFFDILL